MTSQIKITKSIKSTTYQQGISLMLAVLVLAAITAISFSLTTIVFVELKSSSDVVKSEPALYGTLGVTEEALFEYKRYVNERDDGTTVQTFDVPSCYPPDTMIKAGVCDVGGVGINLPGSQPLSEDDPIRVETIYSSQTTIIPLYQLNDYSLQYGKLILQRVPTGSNENINVQVRKISQDPSIPDQIVYDQNLPEGGPLVVQAPFSEPNYEYELILNNTTQDNIQLSIASFAADGVTEKGLPFIGKKVLKVVADYLGLTRTYKVFIPVP